MLSNAFKSVIFLSTMALIACSAPDSSPNSTAPSSVENGNSDAIIGGQPVAANSELNSSIVGIYDSNVGAICTGSLLPGNIVMTAAHCIGPVPADIFIVFNVDMIGTLKNPDHAAALKLVRRVTSAVVNPGWNPKSHATQAFDWHDIALIKFSGKIPAGFKPATMLTDSTALISGQTVTLAGYGVDIINVAKVDPTTVPNIEDAISKEALFCSSDRKECVSVKSSGAGLLRTVNVVISTPHTSEIALDQKSGHGACQGDSGGPAYIQKNGQYFLWGITSRGTIGCGDDALYTNALTYLDWIKATIPTMN